MSPDELCRLGFDEVAHTEEDERLAAAFFGGGAGVALAGIDVVHEGARVRLVYHDPEGDWWFSSGGDDEDEDLARICLPCLLHDDPNLVEISDLRFNWIAELGKNGVWKREPRPADWGSWEAQPPGSG